MSNIEWNEYFAEGDDCIPISDWGKDHWSTLAYLETRAVDAGGVIDNRKMRCNACLHRRFANVGPFGELRDGARYPTRLAGKQEVKNHDDWSCLEDMVAAELIRAWWRTTYRGKRYLCAQAKIELTELGFQVAAKLRKHKARGGSFGNLTLGENENA